MSPFRDRTEAGRELADALQSRLEDGRDGVVLALPRGGVPVALEVALNLEMALDVVVVRKLGVPGHEELAMGAVASGGAMVLNRDVIAAERLSAEVVAEIAKRARAEVERRETRYRGERGAVDVKGRTAILVDDGLATGATMRAAVETVRTRGAGRVVVAVPVASPQACSELAPLADQVVCARTPVPFLGVGRWYDDFEQLEDDDVTEMLGRAASEVRPASSETGA